MLLHELQDPRWENSGMRTQVNSVPNHPMSQAVSAVQKKPNHKYVGSGSSAYVGRTDDPHEMDTVQRLANEKDGTSLFYQWLIDNPVAASNPYFPRVKSNKTANGITYSIVERLVPLLNPRLMSEPLMQSQWEHMFSSPVRNTDPEEIARDIAEDLDFALGRRGIKQRESIADPKLGEAIELLMTEARTGYPDIHDGNLMWRITGNRPHLVFTDPFA